MKPLHIWLIAFALCAAVFVSRHPELLKPKPGPGPAPGPAPAAGEIFRAIFAKHGNKAEAKLHAEQLAEIAQAAKEILAYDWRLGPKLQIKTGYQVAVVRQMIRDRALDGWSYLNLYPELAPTLDTFFDQRVGREPGELQQADRDRWLSAFQDLYLATKWSADTL
jgi:hypothetical protein